MKTLHHVAALLLAGASLNAQQNSSNFKYLDINQVKAGISCKNQVHWDSIGGTPAYEVPQGSGIHAGSSTAIWFGGIDSGGQLREAGQTYRQSGVDFWPGPLNTVDATTTPGVIAAYNKVWKVTFNDINNLVTNHIATSDILTWPANGNTSQNYDPILAPYIDVDNDGYYNPNAGDYPDIKGDQAIYAIFNDNGGAHTSTGGNVVGAEIHLMAYAYGCPYVIAGHNELAYTTFYDYKVINRSQHTLNGAAFTLFSGMDIGNKGDDFTGSDVARSLAYAYNGDNNDEAGNGSIGYGSYAPAQGILMLRGPNADTGDGLDNDRDGCTDCTFSVTPTGTVSIPETVLPEQILMSQYGYFNSGVPSPMAAPMNASEYYGYETEHWQDGTPFSCGGTGYGGTVQTTCVFPDNSYRNGPCSSGWNEVSAGNAPGDRNMLINSNVFTWRPGGILEVEYAFITSFDSSAQHSPWTSVQKLKADADKVKAFYKMAYKPNCYVGAAMGVKEISSSLNASVYPNRQKRC